MSDLQERLEAAAEHQRSFPANREGFAEIRFCGCWIVNLAQGKAVLPCVSHQDAVLKATV